VYGFADGDPVTYDDPYGLCATAGDTIPGSVGQCPVVGFVGVPAVRITPTLIAPAARTAATGIVRSFVGVLASVLLLSGDTCPACRADDQAQAPEASRRRPPREDKAEEAEPDGAHRKGARPSTEERHQKGNTRRRTDQGGEKGDERRPFRRSGRNAGE
jgi:hypothetical protein